MIPVIRWFMAKIDLKNAYLTIPVAAVCHSLLSFQVQTGEYIISMPTVRALHHSLCIFKVMKPIVQFIRQLGICLIIYLDNLLIASPSKPEDLSTVHWLFTALGF